MAEPAIRRLGTFLADLTHDKPADQIHAEILARLRDPSMELDHRLAGIYLHVKDFVPIWTAIRNGVSLPQTSWETVVLPAVVHFSPPQGVKPNLEAATNLWLNARGSRVLETPHDTTPGTAPAPLIEPVYEEPLPVEPPSLLDQLLEPQAPVAARRGRRWVPQTAAVALIAVAAWLVWTGSMGGNALVTNLPRIPVLPSPGSPSPSPSAEASAVPSASPSASPTPGAATTSSTPRPAPTQPGTTTPPAPPGPRPPGIPTNLKVTGRTSTSISLAWEAPANPATVAHYKVYINGFSAGEPTGTSDNALNLQPGTSYTFTVSAVGKDKLESPKSAPLTVSTEDAPAVLNVPKDVPFGQDLSFSGTNWQCADVQIFIDNRYVASTATDSGTFYVSVSVHEIDGKDGYVDVVGTTDAILLSSGSWSATAKCAGGAVKTAGFTVVA